jgi:hypothetical protein
MKILTAFTLIALLFCGFFAPALHSATDALDELNAHRARKGLKPFARDVNLSAAAGAAADYRANYLIKGHVNVVIQGRSYSDYSFLPAGSTAQATGCAAASDDWGWLSCCAEENWTYAGAAWSRGRDGKRYMHLFVRN